MGRGDEGHLVRLNERIPNFWQAVANVAQRSADKLLHRLVSCSCAYAIE